MADYDVSEYTSAALKNDHEFMLEAVKQNGDALKCASAALQRDFEFVLEAVDKYGCTCPKACLFVHRDDYLRIIRANQQLRLLAMENNN